MVLVDTPTAHHEPSTAPEKTYEPVTRFTAQLQDWLAAPHIFRTRQGNEWLTNEMPHITTRCKTIDAVVGGRQRHKSDGILADAFISEVLTTGELHRLLRVINANTANAMLLWDSMPAPARLESRVPCGTYRDQLLFERPGDALIYAHAPNDRSRRIVHPALLIDCKLGKKHGCTGINPACTSFSGICGFKDYPEMLAWLHGNVYQDIRDDMGIFDICRKYETSLRPHLWERFVHSTYDATLQFRNLVAVYGVDDAQPYRTKLLSLHRAIQVGEEVCGMPAIQEPGFVRARDRLQRH